MADEKAHKDKETRCANCFACFAETELCPLEPDYDEDKVLEMLKERIKKNKSGGLSDG